MYAKKQQKYKAIKLQVVASSMIFYHSISHLRGKYCKHRVIRLTTYRQNAENCQQTFKQHPSTSERHDDYRAFWSHDIWKHISWSSDSSRARFSVFLLGLQPSQEKLKSMRILSIFRIVPGMYRKQWLCKILIWNSQSRVFST